MPLITFDILKGRSDAEIKAMLDAAHGAMVKAFHVPRRDRYQVVTQHDPAELIVEDTGLGIARSDKVVVIRVSTRPRTSSEKLEFYRLLTENLQTCCGISSSDVVVSMMTNADEDWSFGHGRAQFLTGELAAHPAEG